MFLVDFISIVKGQLHLW